MAVSEYVNHPISMAPPAGFLAWKLAGLTLNEWVVVGSAILIVLQLYVVLRDKFYRPWKEKHERQAS
jgi:hypothetical protein